MTFSVRKLVCFFVALYLSVSVALADNKPIKAGLFHIVPFGYHDLKSHKVTGITASLMRAIGERTDTSLALKLVPYKRLIASLEAGTIDFAIFFRSERTDQITDSVLPVYDLDTIVLTQRGFIIDTYEDLYGLRLATPLGVRYTPRFDNDKRLKINRVEDYSNAVLMLDKGYVDGVVGPEKILDYQLRAANITKSKFSRAYTLTTNTAWLQFSKKFKDEAVRQRIITAVKALKSEGKVEKILNYAFE